MDAKVAFFCKTPIFCLSRHFRENHRRPHEIHQIPPTKMSAPFGNFASSPVLLPAFAAVCSGKTYRLVLL
jgi:hypothetical protein